MSWNACIQRESSSIYSLSDWACNTLKLMIIPAYRSGTLCPQKGSDRTFTWRSNTSSFPDTQQEFTWQSKALLPLSPAYKKQGKWRESKAGKKCHPLHLNCWTTSNVSAHHSGFQFDKIIFAAQLSFARANGINTINWLWEKRTKRNGKKTKELEQVEEKKGKFGIL